MPQVSPVGGRPLPVAALGSASIGDVEQPAATAPAPVAPYAVAGALSRMSFAFARPVLRIGWQKTLEMSDLPPLAHVDQATRLVGVLEDNWAQQPKTDKRPGLTLWKAILRAHRHSFVWTAVGAFLESATFMVQPVLLRYLIDWVDSDDDFWIGAVLASSLAVASLAQAITHHLLYFFTMRLSMWLRIGFTGVVNGKLMRISSSALASQSAGSVINLISTDVLRFEQGIIHFHFGWMGLVDFVACLFLIANLVGWGAACAGVSVLLLTITAQTRSGKFLSDLRKITAARTDLRIKQLTQVLSGILTVKAFAWELPFSARIAAMRKSEAASIFRSQTIKGINLALAFAGPVMTSLVTFSVYWAQGNTLRADVIYPTVGLLQVLRLSVGKKFSRFWETFPEMDVAVQRLQSFLELPDTEGAQQRVPADGAALEMHNVSMRWQSKSADQPPVISGVSCSLRRGEMLAVVGPVGSGKTAFLLGMLGELHVEGDVRMANGIAYAPQQPWIFAGTVRDNILFNSPFDQARYDAVIEACALTTDVEQLADGDQTEIGEKGVNLSGGQKARVGLARAVYKQGSSLLLIDDPLAAVDPRVADHLLSRCLRSSLLSDVAVVLATHHPRAAETADKVITLDENGQASPCRAGSLISEGAVAAATLPPSAPARQPSKSASPPPKGDKLQLVQKEDKAAGTVSLDTYLAYGKAGGTCLAVAVAVLLLLGQVAMMGADYWLKVWSDEDEEEQRDNKYVMVFGLLCGGCILTGFLRAIAFFKHAVRANSNIHDSALASVVASPMSFFTANPLGRILNRFTADLGQVDELLPVIFFDCLQSGSVVLGALVLVCVAFVYLTAGLPVLFAIFWWLRRYATASLRELKRLDGTSRSPYFTQFTANLSGLVTIRAFGKQHQGVTHFQELLGRNTQAWYWWLMCNRWVGFRLDMLSSGVLIACCVLALTMRNEVDPGLFGLAVAYALSLSGMLQYCVRQSAQVETFMTCVERILHYANELPPEAASPPPAIADFPTSGAVQLDNLQVRYREDLPVVLRGISADIPSGSRVGIVGRTGSGKSSVVQALLGLNQVCGGSLRLGGVDVTKLPLEQRRRAIAYIPQEPTLFQGTVRSNLDPFDQHSDRQLWDAIESARLRSAVSELTVVVEEGGSNFSTGQRQLFSLARAMLRGASIVIMDEATASVDHGTDALIQETIRTSKYFQGATLLVIAHRLETVEHSDLILVFDDGQLVEQGSPLELRARGGIFASLSHSAVRQRDL